MNEDSDGSRIHRLGETRHPGARQFQDREGVWWRAYERVAVDGDDRQPVCLVFECDKAARRVRNYPSNWRDLDARELERLSWAR